MRTLRTIAEVRSALAPHRREGETIGLVPTMGGLHDGHLSLISRARAECDVVVASLFVNPSQFEDPRDLEAYPRDEHRDAGQAADHGVDYLFVGRDAFEAARARGEFLESAEVHGHLYGTPIGPLRARMAGAASVLMRPLAATWPKGAGGSCPSSRGQRSPHGSGGRGGTAPRGSRPRA